MRPAARGIRSGNSASRLKDRPGSSHEDNEDECKDEDGLPVVINKSNMSSFAGELAGLEGNLGSASEAPAGSQWRRRQTDHRRRRSSCLEMECAEADRLVQDSIVLRIRCDFG